MPGKHAPASSRSFFLSLGRALGAALGAVALIVVAIVVLLNRGEDKSGALPIVSSPTSRATPTSPSPTPSPSPTSTRSILPANSVNVEVLNGTTRNGLARETATKIEAEGYKTLKVDNQRPTIPKSTIFYRPGRRAEALAFQEAFPEFTVVRGSDSLAAGTILRVVIGGDYPTST